VNSPGSKTSEDNKLINYKYTGSQYIKHDEVKNTRDNISKIHSIEL